MQTTRVAALMLGVLLPLAYAAAHHSPAMLYDMTQEVTVQGVVTEYQLGNPHIRIYFDVDNAGQKEHWMAEGGSRTVLLRKGWTGNEVKPGDKISVRGHPSRDGAKLIHMEHLVLPDGTEKFAEDFSPAQFDQRRRRAE
jgi:phenylpropionate dioxygenase-like ring-hydroxylating dioxygenase large terminal subunit